MKDIIIKLLLGIAVLLIGTIAVAQGPGNPGRMGQNRQGGFGGPMARFDTDKDGVLSADEVASEKEKRTQ